MAFQKGNKLWALAERPQGAPKLFETPEALIEKIVEYFEWAHANPIMKTVVGWYEGQPCEHDVAHARALTMRGLAAYIGIHSNTWALWRRERPDLEPVIDWADNVMFDQKFTGAAAGLFTPSIIARDLGLADKSEVSTAMTVNISDGDANL